MAPWRIKQSSTSLFIRADISVSALHDNIRATFFSSYFHLHPHVNYG